MDAILRIANGKSVWHDRKNVGFTAGDWWIEFSGRTQRESIIDGELVWVGSEMLNKEVAK